MQKSPVGSKVKKQHSIESKFNALSSVLFIALAVIMLFVMSIVITKIAGSVSKDYVSMYSARAIGTLNAHLNREIALISQASASKYVVEWFEDEFNGKKREFAYETLMNTLKSLYNRNMYIVVDESKNEFFVEDDCSYEEFEPFYTMDITNPKDSWYPACMTAPNDYTFKIDIDKLKGAKFLWVNHKVYSASGKPLGVVASGIQFDRLMEEVFSGYDKKLVWGLVIDSRGIVQADSAIDDPYERIIYNSNKSIQEYYDDDIFHEIITSHIQSVDGFYPFSITPEVHKLGKGDYSNFSISPIEGTDWSVVTFYNFEALFSYQELWPLYLITLVFYVLFLITISRLGKSLIFMPLASLMESIATTDAAHKSLYGLERQDEVGELSRTISTMAGALENNNAQLLKATQNAERANRAKTDFLANMSHEIRTPINAVIGMQHIALKSNDPEQITNSLEKIGIASKQLLELISDILDMAKIESGKFELELKPISLHSVLNSSVELVYVKQQEKNQSITLDIADNVPEWIVSDSHRLTQVMSNLLSNAVKFTPNNGQIFIKAAYNGMQAGKHVINICVSDTGIGIDKEGLEKIFNSFEQADTSVTRRFGGTGLGLAITKKIVEMLGGKISVTSTLGKGSSFCFTLAAQPAAAKDIEDMKNNADMRKKRRNIDYSDKLVMVVDDIEINRDILLAMLEDCNCRIIQAQSGKQAVELYEQNCNDVNLVLMDMQMPEMDGCEAARQIRALSCSNAQTVPIVAVTANVFKEDIDRCMQAGMNSHLGKPVDYDELLLVLDNAFNAGN